MAVQSAHGAFPLAGDRGNVTVGLLAANMDVECSGRLIPALGDHTGKGKSPPCACQVDSLVCYVYCTCIAVSKQLQKRVDLCACMHQHVKLYVAVLEANRVSTEE